MSGAIATLLTAPKTINIDDEDNKGPQRHIYEELKRLEDNDPTLASPYLKASGVVTIPKHTAAITSGNFTITVNFPKYNVAATTGNIVWNATEATIQTAVNSALAGKTVVATYVAGDVDVALTGTLTTGTGNDATVTANGTTVNGAYMTLTTANVDLSADKLGTPVVATPGTMTRSAESVLALFSVVTPTGNVVPQGITPEDSDYETGDNPLSISPGTKDALLKEMKAQGDGDISDILRGLLGCV